MMQQETPTEAVLDKELNEGKFFQTDESMTKQHRRQTKLDLIASNYGKPWFHAKSQILCIVPEHNDQLMMELYSTTSNSDSKGTEVEKFLFIGESGFLLKRVNSRTGQVNQTFRGHSGPVTAAVHYSFPPNTAKPQFLFSGSWDKSIISWNCVDGSVQGRLEGHSDFVKCLHLKLYHFDIVTQLYSVQLKTEDEAFNFKLLLFSGSSDKTIKVWDAETGKTLRKLEGHRRAVESIVAIESKPLLFSCSSDGSVREWNFVTGECLAVFEGHLTNVTSIQLTADDGEEMDERLWTSSNDGTVKKWNILSKLNEQTFTHKENVRCFVQFSRYLITGCRDEKIRVWDVYDERVIAIVDAHLDEVSCMTVSDGHLYSGSYDGCIWRWNLSKLVTNKYKASPSTLQTSKKLPPQMPSSSLKPSINSGSVLTEEEERELAELMED